MDMHCNLRPYLNTRITALLEFQETMKYQDGCFSRVYFPTPAQFQAKHPLGPMPVVKVTCCSPSIELLKGLLKAPEPVPGLPAVFTAFGTCADDPDGLLFDAYELEKLRPPHTFTECENVQLIMTTVQDIEQHFRLQGLTDWEQSYRTARELARRDVLGLKKAFDVLSDIVYEQQAVLDLCQSGNILYNARNELVLADPVALPHTVEWDQFTINEAQWIAPSPSKFRLNL